MSTAVAEKPVPVKAGKKKYRFRLLRGQHSEGKGRDQVTYQADPNANGGKGEFPIIETDKDLMIFNGEFANQQKFEPLYEIAPQLVEVDSTVRRPGETVAAYLVRMSEHIASVKTQTEGLVKAVDSMSLEQLKELCEAEEIEVPASVKKVEEVRALVRKVLQRS